METNARVFVNQTNFEKIRLKMLTERGRRKISKRERECKKLEAKLIVGR